MRRSGGGVTEQVGMVEVLYRGENEPEIRVYIKGA